MVEWFSLYSQCCLRPRLISTKLLCSKHQQLPLCVMAYWEGTGTGSGNMTSTIEFFLNLFIEFTGFDAIIFFKKRIQTSYLLCKKPALYLSTRTAHATEDIFTNSCFSDFSDSLNSLTSLKVLLYQYPLIRTHSLCLPCSRSHMAVSCDLIQGCPLLKWKSRLSDLFNVSNVSSLLCLNALPLPLKKYMAP